MQGSQYSAYSGVTALAQAGLSRLSRHNKLLITLPGPDPEVYFYPGESVTYLSIVASEGEGPGAFYKHRAPGELGDAGLSRRNVLLLWDRQTAEAVWGMDIRDCQGCCGVLQGLGSRWDQMENLDPGANLCPISITYKCVGRGCLCRSWLPSVNWVC